MGQRIKSFEDGSYLEYDRGSFDNWCVFLTKSDGSRRPPRDVDYFNQLLQFASKYGANRIYNDFVCVYDLTGNQVEHSALSDITQIASTYGDDALEINVIFSILYMAMIAEERSLLV